MIASQELDRLPGMDAIDPSGEKLGTVDHAYVDDTTGEPSFALVNTGLFGMKSSFVPLTDAEVAGDQLRLAYDKDRVKDAPRIEADAHLSPDEEAELYRHYGLDPQTGHGTAGGPMGTEAGGRVGETGTGIGDRAGETGTGTGTVGQDISGPETDEAMTRSEEELDVSKQQKELGKARLRKHIVTDHVTRTVPVEREEVRVEREPITDENIDEATSGPTLSEEEHEVTLHAEEPVVEKRAVPKERVRLDKETHTEEEEVEEDVSREEIDMMGQESSQDDRRP